MKGLISILAVLGATVVKCCPLPFNDFRCADNATLLHEAISEYKFDPQIGWAHVVADPRPAKTWPADDHKLSFIPFCYVDQWTKNKIDTIRYKASQMWYKTIGNAGPGQHHRVSGFREVKDSNGNYMFCYADRKDRIWNNNVRSDTLVIDIRLNTYVSSATMGYRLEEW